MTRKQTKIDLSEFSRTKDKLRLAKKTEQELRHTAMLYARELAAQKWKTIPQEVLDGLPKGAVLGKDQEGYWRYMYSEISNDQVRDFL